MLTFSMIILSIFAVSGVFFHSGAVIQPTVAAIMCWALTTFEMTVALFQIDMRSITPSR